MWSYLQIAIQLGEVQGRYRGGTGEVQGRYRGEARAMCIYVMKPVLTPVGVWGSLDTIVQHHYEATK